MIEEIRKYDGEFTESGFKTFVDNVFIQIHSAIMTKEIEKVRHFMSQDVYANIEARVDDLKKRSVIQIFDELNVKSTEITGINSDELSISVDVKIVSRYMDYLLDESGNLVSGNNTSRIERENRLTFSKSKNASGLASVRKCPGCGASVDVSANGLCEYCGTTFNLEDRDWVLVALEPR